MFQVDELEDGERAWMFVEGRPPVPGDHPWRVVVTQDGTHLLFNRSGVERIPYKMTDGTWALYLPGIEGMNLRVTFLPVAMVTKRHDYWD